MATLNYLEKAVILLIYELILSSIIIEWIRQLRPIRDNIIQSLIYLFYLFCHLLWSNWIISRV
jgi:hypothetical protein